MRRLLPVLCLSAFLATGCAATTREIKIQQPQPKPKIEEKIVQEEQAPVKEKKDPYTFRLSDNLQQDYKEYLLLFDHYLDSVGSDRSYLETIGRYQQFIANNQDSNLIDEAKLRIAELYNLMPPPNPASLAYLNNIISNYVQADHYSIRRNRLTDELYLDTNPVCEKTAAWALFYKAIWFKSNKEQAKACLEKILSEYQTSTKVHMLAQEELKEY